MGIGKIMNRILILILRSFFQILEYDDGTPATQSQLAKDVTIFLSWAASPETDQRKKMFIKVILLSMVKVFKKIR